MKTKIKINDKDLTEAGVKAVNKYIEELSKMPTAEYKKQILLAALKKCEKKGKEDAEVAHSSADEALLDYINDKEITGAFFKIKKWYA